VYSKQAKKDVQKIKRAGLKKKTESLLKILEKDPYKNPPRYEKLVGDLL
jgi:toxin YoeB